MSKPEIYLGKIYKPLDYHHDLSKGQRSYLREQGLRERDFSKMDAVAQNDWKQETKEAAYETMRNYKGK